MMLDNKILSVNQIFSLEISKLMQRVAIGYIPSPFTDIFQNQERLSSITTRSSSDYYQPFMSAKKCQQSISYTGPLIWGSIPSVVKAPLNETDYIRSYDSADPSILSHNSRVIKSFVKRMKKYSLHSIDFI